MRLFFHKSLIDRLFPYVDGAAGGHVHGATRPFRRANSANLRLSLGSR